MPGEEPRSQEMVDSPGEDNQTPLGQPYPGRGPRVMTRPLTRLVGGETQISKHMREMHWRPQHSRSNDPFWGLGRPPGSSSGFEIFSSVKQVKLAPITCSILPVTQ